MAFLTNINHRSSGSATVVFSHKSTTEDLNPSHFQASSIRDPRNTWSITTSNQKSSYPLKTNETCNKHVNIITAEEENDVKHAKLVNRVRRLMAKVNGDRFEDLIMVDSLQRLAIDYHFEDEINLILRRRYMQFINTDLFEHQNLYEVSLCFRILRHKGFQVSADIFTKFKGNDENFEEKLNNDIRGLMALYEASQLSTEGEIILDEAANFSFQLLHHAMKSLDDDQARMVRHTLENPYHKTVALFNLNNYIEDFSDKVLQELAELDFSMVQSVHQMELNQISSWWRDMSLCQDLSLARDQPLKWYLWSMAALTNPKLSTQRIDLTKTISLVYIIDDIFDVYGTVDELTIFTEAINRCDINAIEQLPYYMKSSFKALYDITNEIAIKVYEQYGFNPISSLWKSWATLCNAFLVEAKWFASRHIPKAKEYLEIGMVTSGIQVVLVHMFFLLGNATNEDQASLMNDNHGIISSVGKILRLWDDLGSAQDENQDGHDGSYIICFLNEHEGCSIQIAREHVMKLISDSWKRLNRECLSPNPFSATFTKAASNIARMVPLMYSYGDNSSLPLLNDYVKGMLYDEFLL
uniref:Nerolidol synthase 1 n=1 Tax=Atractylodes lancea TaxID=41486 RepID=A0A977P8L2_ATRLA|nr:nerolidol synthase 1 [Atractylodes lancea]